MLLDWGTTQSPSSPQYASTASVQALVSTDDDTLEMLVVDSSACPGRSTTVVVVDGTGGERLDTWSFDADAPRDIVQIDDGYALGGWTDDGGGEDS